MMMRFVSPLVVAACALVAGDDPPATEAKAKAPPQKDAQVRFEPPSGPGAGQALLAKFAGDWDVVKSFYPRAGEPVRAEGTCRQALIHAGRFLQSDFVFGRGEKATTGMGIIGFEPDSGTFTSVWTDSRQTRMSLRRSRDKFDGERIVLYSQSLDPDAPESRRTKTITRLEDGGKKLVHQQFALGADGEERLMMELAMTRKGPASAK
jgi:hypothetical protein